MRNFSQVIATAAITLIAACGSAPDYIDESAPPPVTRPAPTSVTDGPMSIVAPGDVGTPPRDAITTGSGLSYKPLVQIDSSSERPRRNDVITYYFVGWTSSGRPFDDKLRPGDPARSLVSKLIPGLSEGLQLMRAGERFRFWIPQALAYAGASGRPAGALIYDVELVSVQLTQLAPDAEAPGPPPVPDDVAAPPVDAQRTPSGLSYKVLSAGSGPTPSGGNSVTVHYTGWTTDGEMFDSSRVRGEPATFPVGGVIAGFSEGLKLMQIGSSVRLWIPENLAYKGKSGSPQGMLVFDVELLAIE